MIQSSRSVPLPLALRLLRSPAAMNKRVQLWSGQLPDSLPIEIPLLDQAQVIASRQQAQAFTVLLEIPQSALPVQSAYSNRLRAIGWLQCYSDADAIDFNLFTSHRVSPARLPVRLTFFHRPLSLTLILETRSIQANITQVRLSLDCSMNDLSDFPFQQEWERSVFNLLPLPQLLPPPDTNIPPPTANLPSSRAIAHRGRGGGGSEAHWYSTSNLQTTLSSSALLTHYEEQLTQAGWTRQAGEAQDRVLWSVWTLRDRAGRSLQLLLSFVADGNLPDHYAASLWLLDLNHFDAVVLATPAPAIAPAAMIPEAVIWQFLAKDFSAPLPTKPLRVGQLPPEFPDAIELPAETEVLGSLIEESEGDRMTLFLVAPLTSDQLWQHLTEPLLAAGWQALRSDADLSDLGFAVTEKRWQADTFISPTGENECYLSLEAVERHCFDIWLKWDSRVVDPLRQELAARIASLPTFTLSLPEQTEDEPAIAATPLWANAFPVPALSLPEQTEVFQGVTGDGNEALTFYACIATSLSPAALNNHYQIEMQRSGWQRQTTSQSEECYLSLWSLTVQGRSWQATLSLLAHLDRSDRFTGCLKVEPLEISL